jgi:L,D-peptidoglycan transpeptidase YkuD (ErfK/YbiS/YcfS/YnhG family)/cell wall-associated NlpC family hydrolase
MEIVVSGNKLQAGSQSYRCSIGRKGYSANKREGDGCTPVGTFYLREVYYRADRISAPLTGLPVKVISCDDGWCDAPDDEKYNQHVYLPYAPSHEELWRDDHLYDLVVVIGYNDGPVISGAGSAIFLHVAAPEFKPTQGCIGLELQVLQELLKDFTPQTKIVLKPGRAFKVAKNLINLYATADTSSEIVSQALLNARLELEREDGGFVYVVGEDRYHGWADTRHLEETGTADGIASVGQSSFESNPPSRQIVVKSLFADVFSEPNALATLATRLVFSTQVEIDGETLRTEGLAGTAADAARETDKPLQPIRLPGGNRGWIKRSDLSLHPPVSLKDWTSAEAGARSVMVSTLGAKVLAHAEKFIGVPYLWGGCSPFGIDCSGLVQVCYLMEGLQLLRDADIQFTDKRFTEIEPGKLLHDSKFQAGDLLVFGSKNAITHIGIASGDGRFIHASGRQANFGTYFDFCSDKSWGEKYLGAVRLSIDANLSITSA